MYLEKTPRVEPEAIDSILEFIGKKGVPLETFADNSMVDEMAREDFMKSFTRSLELRRDNRI